MQNYGTVSPNEIIDGDPFLITSQELFNLPLNVVTYLGMLILGDNYFGFRIGSVLIGYINLVMLAWIVKVLFEKNEALAEHRYEAAFLIAILYSELSCLRCHTDSGAQYIQDDICLNDRGLLHAAR